MSPSRASTPDTPLRDGDLLAAVDLGSNSFHMVVARYTLGQLRVVDRIREMVRMAEGLDRSGQLSAPVQQRALDCLSRFGQRIRDIPPWRVRALATNSVRRLRDSQEFLVPAEIALGHSIEVVSGREEARLVYLGVAHAQPPKRGELRLVMDIGGGSTECIIGSGLEPIERESLQVGCVATTRRFFANGKLTRKKWKQALTAVAAEFQQFSNTYRALGWDDAMGSSGTIKAIGKICAGTGISNGEITPEALWHVRELMLAAGSINKIQLPGLSDDRTPVIAGGVVVLEAAFATLGIRQMDVSKAAMREGILYDMIGRAGGDDARDSSVNAMMQRYGVDIAQATRVERTATELFAQVHKSWKLDPDDGLILGWAARLHEIGLVIAHSQYHLHGAYVLEHSDVAGFTQQEQQMLAILVRSHRRGLPKSMFDALPARLRQTTRRLCVLLRLAVLMHRSHEGQAIPRLRLRADKNTMRLELSGRWLDERPLLRADLLGEQADIASLGFKLIVQAG
ncbi:exopolyphosphatase [Solilutibacter silvestris]|uniref:Exopolyphosphatase n=1 Tax=Solilutibacter silvestris TaxID=1645665 RepID=A0A2K1PZT4_9GAMM|nr:exopolyphosphatase [Lysobacter silvestris]PNS08304.1 exopolyphosphatase [Lysobacter silvestris]